MSYFKFPTVLFFIVLSLYSSAATSAPKAPKNLAEVDYDLWLPDFDEWIDHRLDKLIAPNFSNHFPRMNIQELENSYHVEAELPGVKKEEIQIKLKDNYLIISGEKKIVSEENKKTYRRIERASGSFYRAISIPQDVDKDKITAELSDGILKIDLAKAKNAPASVERKIQIK